MPHHCDRGDAGCMSVDVMPHRGDIGQQLAEQAEAGRAHVAAVQAVAVSVDCDVPLLVLCHTQDRMRVPGRCGAKAPHRSCGPCEMHAPMSLRAGPHDGTFPVTTTHHQLSAFQKMLRPLAGLSICYAQDSVKWDTAQEGAAEAARKEMLLSPLPARLALCYACSAACRPRVMHLN